MTLAPGHFEVFRIPVLRGRAFTRQDDRAAPPVVIINKAMADQFWPDGDPVGEHLAIGRGVMQEFAGEPAREIIGIVGSTRDGGLNNDPAPRMYVPQTQITDASNALNVGIMRMAWVVRTIADPSTVSTTIQETLRQTTGLPVSNVETMTSVVSRPPSSVSTCG